jgi:hypothetical protein
LRKIKKKKKNFLKKEKESAPFSFGPWRISIDSACPCSIDTVKNR